MRTCMPVQRLDANFSLATNQSKPGGETKPINSFSTKRPKVMAVLSRPLAAIA
jgi:hypothetical protein